MSSLHFHNARTTISCVFEVECLGPEMQPKELQDPQRRKDFETDSSRTGLAQRLKGVQVLARKTLSEDKIHLKVLQEFDADPDSPPRQVTVLPMVRVGNSWKLGGSTRGGEHWEMESGEVQTFVP